MSFERIVALLTEGGARFRVIEHPPEGKSEDVARLRGTQPGQGAKAMLCRNRDGDEPWVLAVLPGDRKLDFKRVAAAAGAKKMTLASVDEVLRETGCVIGAVPPFTFWPRIRLFVDPALVASNDEIAFNAARLDRSMVLDARDYVRLAKPELVALAAEA